ncbi:MAG: oligosaccharide flippase family protein, partial [Planctomycetota bacterium]|nr:oligosaccharide flippase family protein [Planctomycetota bacterium]
SSLAPLVESEGAVPQATPRRYFSGVAFQLVGRGGQALAALGVIVLLARTLGIEAVGVFASWEAIFTLLDIVVDGGTGNALVRRAGAKPSTLRSLLARATRFRVMATLLASSIAIGISLFDPRVRATDPALWVCVIGLWTHLLGTRACVFALKLNFRFPSGLRIATAVLGFFGVLALSIYGCTNPMAYLSAIAVSRMLGNLAIWLGARPLLKSWTEHNGDKNDGIDGFEKEAIALGAGWLVREAYGRLDILALRALAGPAAAGIYAPVRKTFTLALQIPAFVTNVAMPVLSSQAEHSLPDFHQHVRKLAKNLTWLVVPLAALSAPFAYIYLDLVFGSEYGARGVTALWILIGTSVLVFPGSVFTTAIIARGRAGTALGISLFALGACIVGNWIWVPSLQVTGAAVARLITEGVALVGAAWCSARLR